MNQSTREFVIVEWTYSPPDYFKAPIRLVRDAYAIAIANGKVEVRVEASLYDRDPQLQEALHDAVKDWFVGAQLASHRAYELSDRMVTRVYFDAIAGGQRGPRRPQPAASAAARDAGAAGQETPGSGERPLEAEPTMAELAETYSTTDPLLDSLLRRYDQAVTDPAREVARLCAVPDALSSIFGGEGAARAALNISETDWSRLAELANVERHRAQPDQEGHARQSHASDVERAEARAIALRMILAYLRYMNSGAGSPST